MHHPLSQTWLDRWFQVVVWFKGINGGFELIGGSLLLLLPSSRLHDIIWSLARVPVIAHHSLLMSAVTKLDHSFTGGVQIYTAVYLLLHGIIKVGLVVALLSRRYAWYPAAIVVLILFMLYQVYRIFTEGQWVFDGTLTVIDGLVVWLTLLEYKRHKPDHQKIAKVVGKSL